MSDWPGLPSNVVSRNILVDDLTMHVFEAIPDFPERAPLVLLLHGFPELAFSWRKVIGSLCTAGYHVVAPDQRGYGQTISTSALPIIQYSDDISPFTMPNLVNDIVSLVTKALGYETVHTVVGHDFGSMVAGFCALSHPEIFKSVVLMSAPFTGHSKRPPPSKLAEQLSALVIPRKHYTHYYSTASANMDMLNAPQGLHQFLREQFHMKSADWEGNDPKPLVATAESFSTLPRYYVMLLEESMPQAVAGTFAITNNVPSWLTDEALSVYVREFGQRGFQGALNWYRCIIDPVLNEVPQKHLKVEVPALFISGEKDWGTWQIPGAVDQMKETCVKMGDIILIPNAGHWVQQEQSEQVIEIIVNFMAKV